MRRQPSGRVGADDPSSAMFGGARAQCVCRPHGGGTQVAANANAALPVNASVSANVLSLGSSSAAVANQDAAIDQYLSGDAIANAPQTAVVDQSDGTDTDATGTDATTDGASVEEADLGTLDTEDSTDTLPSDLTGVTEGLVEGANALLADGCSTST